MERKAEEKERRRKGKRSADAKGGAKSVTKRSEGVVISEPRSSGKGDKFVIDDFEGSGEEGDAQRIRERSKDKLRVSDSRNRIINQRIAKDVKEVSTDRVDFYGEDMKPDGSLFVPESLSEEITDPASPMFHKVKLEGHVFKFSSTLINKHYGFKDGGATGATLKLGDIIEDLTGKALKVWPAKGQL
ncbi:hypothetical protein LIER_40064 [Lithospermum erythrorhizon]|uniref:Uncharacterized protein n=1 Tax=Lithospermum erythrorhizon TaxID=34254 RepID=A0AAV3QQ11_LITER